MKESSNIPENEFLLILPTGEKMALGAVRCIQGLMVAVDDYLYLRGLDEALITDKRIMRLPVLHSYTVDDEERLFPLKGLTPVGKLPRLQWQPIKTFIDIQLPVSAMPAKLLNKMAVNLKQTTETREGCALITSLEVWKAYAETAPSVRLEHLQFAVASNGDVLILGTPLPPVQGNELYKDHEILVPAGYAFEVPLMANILQKKLNTDRAAVLLYTSCGNWHKIPIESFVSATRSAVRLTSLNEPLW